MSSVNNQILGSSVSNNILLVDTEHKLNILRAHCLVNNFFGCVGDVQWWTGMVRTTSRQVWLTIMKVDVGQDGWFIRKIHNEIGGPLNIMLYGTCDDSQPWTVALPLNPSLSYLNATLRDKLEFIIREMRYKSLSRTLNSPHPTLIHGACYISKPKSALSYPLPAGLELMVGKACIAALVLNHQFLIRGES